MAHLFAVPVASCSECGLESAGRCPTCGRHLCFDHFGLDQHEPCAAGLREHMADMTCYICGAPAIPRQWSAEVFAHYIDLSQCAGCHRPICDGEHTRVTGEDLVLSRDGMRSHRYHYTRRYCPACAPVRSLGGLLGLSRLAIGVAGVAIAAAIVYVQILH